MSTQKKHNNKQEKVYLGFGLYLKKGEVLPIKRYIHLNTKIMLHAGQLSEEAKQAYKIVEAQSKRIKELEDRVRKLEETIEMVSPLFEYSEPQVYRNVLKLINREDLI